MPERLEAHESILTFQSDGCADELRVLSLSGSEGVSELSRFGVELGVVHPEGNRNRAVAIDLNAVVGARARLDIHHAEGSRPVFGIVSHFEQGLVGESATAYFAELVPTVWLLTQRYQSRIFQNVTVRQIIEKVMKTAGIAGSAYRFALQRGDYVQRDYCVQYRETDWNFVSRLMEEEGIFYLFEHKNDQDILVMADSPDANTAIDGNATVLYRDPSGMVEVEEFVSDFRYAQQIRPGKVVVKDYNFEKPAYNLTKDKTASLHTELELYDFPGLYIEDGPGRELSRIRLEAMQARRLHGQGQSACRRLVSGYRFTLKDFPRAEFNQEYLVTTVQHEGSQPLGQDEPGGRPYYRNMFRVIPSSVPFRPTRVTPKPVIDGAQTAVVTGPAGEEIYTDKYGRVKVQFPWDREGQNNEKSSCWIRVAQLWAGQNWGAMYIPRIGHEVIVDFLEGDPDRPIITGRVYNGDNMPPYALDGEKTKSTIKSNSSKGGGGSNEYRFEDKKGSEEIYQHAQKDLTIATENDKNQTTGHNETLMIGHDRTKTVKNDETTTVNANRTETVDKNETITIHGARTETVDKDETITINANRTETVAKEETITINGGRTETVAKKETISIGSDRTENVGANESVTIASGRTLSVGKDQSVTIGGDSTLSIEKGLTETIGKSHACDVTDSIAITAGKDITLTCGSSSVVMKKDGTIQISGKDVTIKGSGAINVKASKDVTIKGQKILEN